MLLRSLLTIEQSYYAKLFHTSFDLSDFDDSDEASSSDLSEYGSEDELDDYSSKPKKPTSKSGSPTKPATTSPDQAGDLLGMKDYMDMMDRELANTTIGQSFEKVRRRYINPDTVEWLLLELLRDCAVM